MSLPLTRTRAGRSLLGACAVATLGLALAGPAGAASSSLPAGPTTVTAAHCPAAEITKVWDGAEQTNSSAACGDIRDWFDHLFYPGRMMTTAMSHSYSENVVVIQLRLRDLNYRPMVVDGYYGSQTAGAVKRYQHNHGLVVDGKTGLQTWRELFGLGGA